ncbi:MAG TPA: lysophospholipid acyltransferase family protein [Pseudonocardiaceae bacterium]|jgi:1-acyl-sn-glycerol-3-phosphate acyltransferase|nr:lysophospholipid acyltransferase family protein [Pseudonocardiaceae bacterium]
MIAALIAGFARLVTGATARWLVEPRSERQRVYFANHASHFDFITIWAALPPPQRVHTRPVAAADYWTAGRIKRYLAARVFRALLIDRSGGDTARGAIEQMVGALRDGNSLIIFPEGTRGDGSEIAPFRSGLYHLAMAAPDAELVPVLLENLNRVLPKGEMIPVPVIACVTFGPPLALAPGEARDALLGRARAAVAGLRENG